MSGKYGPFSGLDNVSSKYSDSNLPLFGPNSILGRSIVIHRFVFVVNIKVKPQKFNIYFFFLSNHRDADGGRWICGNIENTREMITAVGTFRYPLVGSIYFIQEANDPFSDTR